MDFEMFELDFLAKMRNYLKTWLFFSNVPKWFIVILCRSSSGGSCSLLADRPSLPGDDDREENEKKKYKE